MHCECIVVLRTLMHVSSRVSYFRGNDATRQRGQLYFGAHDNSLKRLLWRNTTVPPDTKQSLLLVNKSIESLL